MAEPVTRLRKISTNDDIEELPGFGYSWTVTINPQPRKTSHYKRWGNAHIKYKNWKQWYLNGETIEGARGMEYEPVETGNYS